MNAVELHKRSLGMPDSWYENVLEFHRRFAPHVLASVPAVPPGGPEAHYGLGAIREELAELERAAAAGDVPGTADALGDLLYVTIRMGLIWGVDLRLIFAEIHASNMTKDDNIVRGDGKVLKGPNYRPPDIEGVLRAQGWAGPPDPPVSSATRLMTWRVGDDTGLSSRCLARRLAPPAGIGVPIGGHGTDHPLDPVASAPAARRRDLAPVGGAGGVLGGTGDVVPGGVAERDGPSAVPTDAGTDRRCEGGEVMTPLNPSTLTAPTHTAIAPDVDSPADPSPDLADLAVDADLAAAAADRRRLDWLSVGRARGTHPGGSSRRGPAGRA
jgi:predicted HAD superfamily Cof-like phosphohydrolase